MEHFFWSADGKKPTTRGALEARSTGGSSQPISRTASTGGSRARGGRARARPRRRSRLVLEAHPGAAATADADGKYPFELLPSSASDDAATLLVTACIAASGEGVLWRVLDAAATGKKPPAEAVRAAVEADPGAAARPFATPKRLEAGRRRARAAAAWAGREERLASRRAGDGHEGDDDDGKISLKRDGKAAFSSASRSRARLSRRVAPAARGGRARARQGGALALARGAHGRGGDGRRRRPVPAAARGVGRRRQGGALALARGAHGRGGDGRRRRPVPAASRGVGRGRQGGALALARGAHGRGGDGRRRRQVPVRAPPVRRLGRRGDAARHGLYRRVGRGRAVATARRRGCHWREAVRRGRPRDRRGGSRRGGAAVRDAGGLEAGRRRARAAAAWAGREGGLASRRAGDGHA